MVQIDCNLLTLTRMCGIGCAVAIITMSIFRFMTLSTGSIQDFILTVHYILLGMVLALSEFHFEYVLRNFHLLSFIIGRGIYLLFLGTILFTETAAIFQFLVAIVCIGVGCIYIFIGMTMKTNEKTEEGSNLDESVQPKIR